MSLAAVAALATGTVVTGENDIVSPGSKAGDGSTCETLGDTTAIAVSADSTSGTVADYNLVNLADDTALAAFGTHDIVAAVVGGCIPTVCPVAVAVAVAVVDNLTVTQPQKTGYLTVYPDGDARPVVSNLDFSPCQTVENLVTSGIGTGNDFVAHNGSPGKIQLIADEFGYFIASS
jgi:hypothetical protein